MAISPNNKHIISTSDNNALRLWDITSGKTVRVMQGHNEQVTSVAFSPCGKKIASSGYDKTVRLWSAETGKEMLVLVDHTENVNIVKYAPDGRRLVSGGSDKTVRFWDPETGQPGPVCYASLGRVLSLDYSPDGRRVVSGHSRRDVCLWGADSGDLVFAISNNLGAVRCVAFSPDGKWIVSSGYDPIVHMWDSSTGHLIFKVSGHFRPVEFCAFSPNGLQIASREVGGIVRLWEVNSRTSTLSNSNSASGGVSTVAFSPDGRSILSCNLGRGIQRQSTLTGAYESITITMEQEGLRSFALSLNGREIATGGRAGTIQLWDSQTEAAERTFVGETMSADILVYSPCGRWIVSTHWNEVVQLWDLHDSAGQSQVICKATDTSMVVLFVDIYVAFSPLGHQFVVATRRGLIQLFEPQSKNPCSPVKVMTCASNVSSLIYTPDGQGLVFGTTSGSLLFWDLQSGTVEAELKGHQDKVTCITYSPCGKWLLSGSKDRTIRIWQLRKIEGKDWHCIVVVRGCSEPIRCLAWNPVTPMEFVSGSTDGSVRVWRMAAQDDGVAYVRMLWGNDVGRLCTSDLMFKGAIGLSPINRQLLLQRGTVVDPLPCGEEGDNGFSKMEIED
jgi:WD40 repeat protein